MLLMAKSTKDLQSSLSTIHHDPSSCRSDCHVFSALCLQQQDPGYSMARPPEPIGDAKRNQAQRFLAPLMTPVVLYLAQSVSSLTRDKLLSLRL